MKAVNNYNIRTTLELDIINRHAMLSVFTQITREGNLYRIMTAIIEKTFYFGITLHVIISSYETSMDICRISVLIFLRPSIL
ncbi:hypothetical protein FACS1894203_3620 [Bacteroidia bacterium]|nr:hypothetical protein FACS1894203_3620 [Bacteroidia bacterium]